MKYLFSKNLKIYSLQAKKLQANKGFTPTPIIMKLPKAVCLPAQTGRAYHDDWCRGFTIIELITSVSIFLLLTSIILVNHSKFSGAILLETLAYDIALSIRESQTFGLSVKEFEVGSGEFQAAYGIHVDDSSLPITQYTLFADRGNPRNGKYDKIPACGVPGSECVEVFTLQKGNTIKEFCGELSDGTLKCGPGALNYLEILFVRPNPDAIITSNLSETYSNARIFIKSPKGIEREIVTAVTGQISITQ